MTHIKQPLATEVHRADEKWGLPVDVTPLRYNDDNDVVVRDNSNGREVLVTYQNFYLYYESEAAAAAKKEDKPSK